MGVAVLVGLTGPTRTLAQSLARLLDLEVEAVATAEEALRRPPEGPLLTRMRLPRMDGASLLRRASQQSPGRRGLLLTRRPVLGPPSLALDPDQQRIVPPHPALLLFEGLRWASGTSIASRHRALYEAWRQGPEQLTKEVQASLHSAEAELALEVLAHTAPPASALATLGDWLSDPRVPPSVAERTIELLPRFQDTGLDLVASIAGRTDFPPPIRAKAIRELGRRYPLPATQPILLPLLDDPSLWCRSEAAHALVEGARGAAAMRSTVRLTEGLAYEVLRGLARGQAVDGEARARAVELLAREAPTAQVLPILSDLAASPRPELATLAAQWLVRADGLEAEAQREILEDHERPLAERRLALERLARQLPEEQSAPLLERAESSATPELRDRALELHFSAAEGGLDDSLARATQGGYSAQRAALLGALEHGRGSPTGLLAIAASGFEESLVVAALRVLGARYDAPIVGPALRAALGDQRPAVVEAALLALVQLGERGWPLLMEVAHDPKLPAKIRAAALGELAEAAEPERVRATARRLANDPDPILAAASVRAVVLSGATALPELAQRLAAQPRAEHYQGWIEGAVALGSYGYGALSILVQDPSTPLPIRGQALRTLVQNFSGPDVQPLVDVAPEELRVLALRPEAADPAEKAVPPPPPAAPVPEASPTRGAASVRLPEGRSTAGVARGRRRPPSALPVASGTPTPSAEVAAEEHPEDRAPTKPVPPALGSGPTHPAAPAASPIPRAVSSRPKAPAAPLPHNTAVALPAISQERAEKVLEECLRQGAMGLQGLKLLALSPRVPDPVRAAAVRHLASDFDPTQRGEVLVKCLRGPPLVQATALGCLMVQKDPPRDALEALARDPSADPNTRLRTLRFLAARFGRHGVAPLLLWALECGQAELERAALECLFTSIRFTPERAVEEALVNLLREHESLEIKTWAARALGTFGGKSALSHLDHFTGLFVKAEVKAVAKRARQRILARIKE